MNIKSLIKKLLLTGLAILPVAQLGATPTGVDVYRKKIGNKTVYRICIGDFHKDYPDGRSRKKHHAQLMQIAHTLQQHGKTVQFIVEDMGHYTGPNQAIAQQIDIVNKQDLDLENFWVHTQPTNIIDGGLLQGITEFCMQHGIPCQNIEFRHPSSVRGAHYQPTYQATFDNTLNKYEQLRRNAWFQAEFPQLQEFIDYCWNRAKDKFPGTSTTVIPRLNDRTPEERAIISSHGLIDVRLLDSEIINALHQHDLAQTDYVFVVAGGAHLRFISNDKQTRYWDKFGFESLHSIEIPSVDSDDRAEAIKVPQGDRINLENEIMPYLGLTNVHTKPQAPNNTQPVNPKPAQNPARAQQVLAKLIQLCSLNETQTANMLNNLSVIDRGAAGATIDASLFSAWVVNSNAMPIDEYQDKMKILGNALCANSTTDAMAQLATFDFDALNAVANSPEAAQGLAKLTPERLDLFEANLNILLIAANTAPAPQPRPTHYQPTPVQQQPAPQPRPTHHKQAAGHNRVKQPRKQHGQRRKTMNKRGRKASIKKAAVRKVARRKISVKKPSAKRSYKRMTMRAARSRLRR